MRRVGAGSMLSTAMLAAFLVGGGMAANAAVAKQAPAHQAGIRRNKTKRDEYNATLAIFGDLGGYRKRPFRTVAQDKRDARKARNKRR